MDYEKTVYVNDNQPAVNASNLNKMEQGIYNAVTFGYSADSNAAINKDNYTSFFTNANLAKSNRTYFLSWNITNAMISNLPEYGADAILMTFNAFTTGNHGRVQIFHTNQNHFWHRFEEGSGDNYTYTSWMSIGEKDAYAIGKTNTVILEIDTNNKLYKISGSGYIWGKNNFVNAGGLSTKSVSLNTGTAGTYLMVIRGNNLTIQSQSSYAYKTNDIIVAVLFLNASGVVTTSIWQCGGFAVEEESDPFGIGRQDTVAFTIDDDNHTFTISGSGYIWNKDIFIGVASIGTKSVSLNTGTSSTYFLVIRNSNLMIVAQSSYSYTANDIVIAVLFLNASGVVTTKIWVCGESELLANASYNNVKAISDIKASGDFKITSAGEPIFQYYDVTQGEKYKVYAWNMSGFNTTSPILYLMYSGGTYTSINPVKYNQTWVWDVTVPANCNEIRLYALKDSSAASCSCSYALTKVEGTIIDLIDEKLSGAVLVQNTLNRLTCKIFKKVVCCGDSYTAGYIKNDSSAAIYTNEEFAWPHFMSTLTGNEWINCGCSGCTTITWQSHERGLPAAQAAGRVQAYTIGLMINDAADTENHVPVGTIDDIGTEAQTYYGAMSKIIRELNAISPLAKIFVFTIPNTNSLYNDYNQAVKDIVNAYANTYPVFCLDLNAYHLLYENQSLVNDYINGHYTALGYEQFSEIMAYIMSDFINTHVSSFQNVHKIPYQNET